MTVYTRFRHNGGESLGIVEDGWVHVLRGDLFGAHERTGESFKLADVTLLAPLKPTKVHAVALNYRSHLGDRPPLKVPGMFLKPTSCIIGPEEPIILPKDAGRVDYEGELVVVIGRTCRKVSVDQAMEYVFGYTCGNDVSAREWQREDRQWWRAKGADTFGPIGPWIVTGLDPAKLHLVTRVNGRVVQETDTELLIFSVPEIISFASQAMTLEPGDIIFTGTPGVTAQASPGDVCEVEISGIGVLRNPVRAEE
jgi:2-keto-4-pentenoate hydratase/2-oxohepta-3-ene-1,7-dioic acid hydratase in catechol pathway